MLRSRFSNLLGQCPIPSLLRVKFRIGLPLSFIGCAHAARKGDDILLEDVRPFTVCQWLRPEVLYSRGPIRIRVSRLVALFVKSVSVQRGLCSQGSCMRCLCAAR